MALLPYSAMAAKPSKNAKPSRASNRTAANRFAILESALSGPKGIHGAMSSLGFSYQGEHKTLPRRFAQVLVQSDGTQRLYDFVQQDLSYSRNTALIQISAQLRAIDALKDQLLDPALPESRALALKSQLKAATGALEATWISQAKSPVDKERRIKANECVRKFNALQERLQEEGYNLRDYRGSGTTGDAHVDQMVDQVVKEIELLRLEIDALNAKLPDSERLLLHPLSSDEFGWSSPSSAERAQVIDQYPEFFAEFGNADVLEYMKKAYEQDLANAEKNASDFSPEQVGEGREESMVYEDSQRDIERLKRLLPQIEARLKAAGPVRIYPSGEGPYQDLEVARQEWERKTEERVTLRVGIHATYSIDPSAAGSKPSPKELILVKAVRTLREVSPSDPTRSKWITRQTGYVPTATEIQEATSYLNGESEQELGQEVNAKP